MCVCTHMCTKFSTWTRVHTGAPDDRADHGTTPTRRSWTGTRRPRGGSHTPHRVNTMVKLFHCVYPYKIWRAHSDHGFSVRHAKSTLFDPPFHGSGPGRGRYYSISAVYLGTKKETKMNNELSTTFPNIGVKVAPKSMFILNVVSVKLTA